MKHENMMDLHVFPNKTCVEYHLLIVKLNSKSSKNDQALKNLNAMCDVELILGLTCILPLLQCVHMFIKIVQAKDVFVCDFAESIKQMQQELYRLYYDPYTKFDDPTFDDFNVIETFTNDVLPMSWFSNINGLENTMYLAFSFAKHKYLLYLHELSNVKKFQPLTREAFKLVLDKVKQQCEGIANSLYQIA
jgi:hypothetical protein